MVSLWATMYVCRTFPPGRISPRQSPPHLGHILPAVKAKIWKLALTRIPDLNRSTRRDIVVEGGNVLHHERKGGKIVREKLSGSSCTANKRTMRTWSTRDRRRAPAVQWRVPSATLWQQTDAEHQQSNDECCQQRYGNRYSCNQTTSSVTN